MGQEPIETRLRRAVSDSASYLAEAEVLRKQSRALMADRRGMQTDLAELRAVTFDRLEKSWEFLGRNRNVDAEIGGQLHGIRAHRDERQAIPLLSFLP